jgi:hypothetical protein
MTCLKTNQAPTPDLKLPVWTARLHRLDARLLRLWLLLVLPFAVQAQYAYAPINGKITITGYTGSGGAVTIPDKIEGLPVVEIGVNAFTGHLELTAVTIPNSVTNIEDRAFEACAGLTSATIGNGVTNIGNGAFDRCTGLTNVTIGNNVTSIGGGAFYNCTNLTSATIPNSVTSIDNGAFGQCTSLRIVTMGYNVTSIGSATFTYCPALRGIFFEGNAPAAGSLVFLESNQVTVYYLPGTKGWGATFGGRPAVPWNPQIQSDNAGFGVKAGQFSFNVTGTSDLTFVVEAAPSLAQPIWSPLSTNILAGGTALFSDPQWTNYPTRLYRLRIP